MDSNFDGIGVPSYRFKNKTKPVRIAGRLQQSKENIDGENCDDRGWKPYFL